MLNPWFISVINTSADLLKRILIYKAKREKIELRQEYDRRSNNIVKMERQIKSLQQQINDANEQQIKDTQVLCLSHLYI